MLHRRIALLVLALLASLWAAVGVAQKRSLDELLSSAPQSNSRDFISTKPDWMRLCGDDETRAVEHRALAIVFSEQRAVKEQRESRDRDPTQTRLAPMGPGGGGPNLSQPANIEAGEEMLADLAEHVDDSPCFHWSRAWLAEALKRPAVAADALDRLPERHGNDPIAKEMRALRARALAAVGTVEVTAVSRHTRIAVDGRIPRPASKFIEKGPVLIIRLDPGRHRLDLIMPGYEKREAVEARAGETLSIRFEPAAVAQEQDDEFAGESAPKTSTWDSDPGDGGAVSFGPWPMVAFLAGGVGIGTGIAATIKAAERESLYDDSGCARVNHEGCTDVKSEQMQAETLQLFSFLSAGALIAVGITLLMLEHDEPRGDLAQACVPVVGSGAGVTCTFGF